MDEQGIAFVANLGDWVSVKKLKVTDKMDPRTVIEFLASLNTGLDKKVEENLKKIVDLKNLDSIIEQECSKGKTEKDISNALAFVASTKTSKVINEVVDALTHLQEGERKEVKEFCKVYALRKTMKTL
ncbi:MAG: DUF2666 family protein, partial [Candidatus Diapherotrites archaeon]|nr:DUF2666 family protein [Candidatus Diapherotrites archaeon]